MITSWPTRAAAARAHRTGLPGRLGRLIGVSDAKADGTNEGALWGARFTSGPSPELAALSRSTHFDWDLALYDIAGSHAHAKGLAAAGYLTPDEARAMHEGLDALARAIAD